MNYIDYACLGSPDKRPDIWAHMVLWGWGDKPVEAVYDAWWQIRTPADPSWPYPTLGDYAYALGCAIIPAQTGPATGGGGGGAGQPPYIPVPPNTSPGSGGIVVGGPKPGSGGPLSQWQSITRWAQDNPLIVGAALITAVLVLWKPGGVKFSR